jgi:type II restriction enzyme
VPLNENDFPSTEQIDSLLKRLIGEAVNKPEGATLAGHAAGLPFEDLVHETLSGHFGKRVQRHYEALNNIFIQNVDCTDYEERLSLLGPKSIQFLLKRGKKSMSEWSPNRLFEVKQDDTAESIIFSNSNSIISESGVILIDVKTQYVGKKAQAPNIMSADKLARACVYALEENEVPFEVLYVGVKWDREQTVLRCVDIKTISIMKIDPRNIYINWVAAQQIQFHPFDVNQDYEGTRREWCQAYLRKFCESLEERIEKEVNRLSFYKHAISN